ncbi:hypothetical protein [Zunongwangia sp. HGR-M22]|uniref:hypothetical protein n=1 Tax=Zunongwangia sp. HGR-M22 TaxID=3015168 RepID=UPI0022DE15F2|nr:hypothetical protein [Zunongwangia sp. HGR-M22]WBL24516.1 hypothetical protein PBT91_11430 [Zunongwangia sp. HGR-M22]
MKYPYLETEFNENLDKQVVKIINQYWKIENRTFLYSPTKLRNKFGITQPRLNSIVKNNSKTKLFLDECVECEKPIIIPVTSQSTAKNKIENPDFICSDCRSKLNRAP